MLRSALLVLVALVGGCASLEDKKPTAPPPPPKPHPTAPAKPVQPPLAPAKPTPPPSPVAPAAPLSMPDEQATAFLLQVFPVKLADKDGWASDLKTAFRALHIPPSRENYCAVVAVIEQESSFQADPQVPGLPAIVKQEIEQRRLRYGIPQTIVDWMLSTTSSDGRSYQQRIDALKTERELNDLIEEIIASIPAGKQLFPNYNPIRTGGPMQVSVEFAESHVRARPYPYPIRSTLRDEVFTRHGGLYFGAAILLDYPAPYDDLLYRFADFNSGRYSSRNAAFQQAVARLSGRSLATDGDLLRYEHGQPSAVTSSTEAALLSVGKILQVSASDIRRDLLLEKLSTFSLTPLYNQVFAQADKKGTLPREVMPSIDLRSPKFTRKLTTAWFANRVNQRFQNCLKRGNASQPPTPRRNTRISKQPARH
ncbi:MAG: DUF1615 domain-containing protein [Gallionella sp.]|nr:DUF1615 domain-containing protein [Gallionella sp.]MDD4947535.1 DUF1615 domain-containing protein [Gallionella sp.]